MLTFLPVDALARLFVSLSLSLSLSRYKTARRVRCFVSFRLFRSRRSSVSLCALLIFLLLRERRPLGVSDRFSLSLSPNMHEEMIILMMGRGTH